MVWHPLVPIWHKQGILNEFQFLLLIDYDVETEL